MTLACSAAFATPVLVGAMALSGNAPANPSPQPRAVAAVSSHVQVTQVEYRLTLSRGVVNAGRVSLEAIDRGMDPHDLRVRALGSNQEVALPQLTPGQRWDGVVSLRPGVYSLWCSLPEHAKLGMRATLTVVR